MTTDMPSKISTAKVMLQILGWFSIAVGAFLMLMFFLAGAIFGTASGDGAVAAAIFGVLGLGFGIFAVGFGVLHLFTARGMVQRKPWAKVCAIVLAILHVVNFPIGTVLSVFIFIGIFSDEANTWFVES
jgi:hypothetical protein